MLCDFQLLNPITYATIDVLVWNVHYIVPCVYFSVSCTNPVNVVPLYGFIEKIMPFWEGILNLKCIFKSRKKKKERFSAIFLQFLVKPEWKCPPWDRSESRKKLLLPYKNHFTTLAFTILTAFYGTILRLINARWTVKYQLLLVLYVPVHKFTDH